jgi:replication-associated recombination protein RarA
MDKNLQEALDSMREPLSVAVEPKKLRAFLYGDFGIGKTTLTS